MGQIACMDPRKSAYILSLPVSKSDYMVKVFARPVRLHGGLTQYPGAMGMTNTCFLLQVFWHCMFDMIYLVLVIRTGKKCIRDKMGSVFVFGR